MPSREPLSFAGGVNRALADPLHVLESDAHYPARLRQRLGESAPPVLCAFGNLDLLPLPKTALFCSARCPGDAILAAYDQATRWRDEGRCVVSGFHSPVEKECLRILLRGKQPLIICPARSLDRMRIPREWRAPLSEGRLLLLSPFAERHRRQTAELARQRNDFAAALADHVYVPHVTPGGSLEKLLDRARAWGLM